jgi:hypothetical protein
MKLRIQFVWGLVAVLAIAPAFWTDLGSAQAQSSRQSSETTARKSVPGSLQLESFETMSGPLFTRWSVPEPVEALNTFSDEVPMCISRDGLSLYIQRTNPVTDRDLYVVHRPDLEAEWGAPVKLPNTINTNAEELGAFLSIDGLSLYFGSYRAGGMGGCDLYVSRRTNAAADGGWQPPENLSTVNSPGVDFAPALFEDPESGTTHLYFACAPEPGGQEEFADIYMSVLGPGGFEPPTRVAELSSHWMDRRPYLRHDGLEIFLVSDRSGPWAIYRSRRNSTTEPWSVPMVVVDRADLGDPHVLGVSAPVISWDGTTLYVTVWDDIGWNDNIFVAHRTKVLGRFAE